MASERSISSPSKHPRRSLAFRSDTLGRDFDPILWEGDSSHQQDENEFGQSKVIEEVNLMQPKF